MGNDTATEWASAARLVRRTGFGAIGADVDAVLREGTAHYVARILGADPDADPGAKKTPPPTFARVARAGKDADPDAKKQVRMALRAQGRTLIGWWLRRMVAVQQPFGEKATFAWHAHFATSLKKVKFAALMYQQNERQRRLATGDFGTLAYTMLTDAATQRWLDGAKNTVKGPNENLSREFMEIFTLGHSDGYTEEDVRQAARALTGYKIDPRNGSVQLRPRLHDNGSKTLLGVTGNLDAKGFCDAVLAGPGCPGYVVTRMWHAFVSNTAPSSATLDRLLTAYGANRDLKAMFAMMFTDPSFAAAQGTYIVGPVEWLIGAVRALHVPLDDAKQLTVLAGALEGLGQLPFFPPSVGGWPSGPVWMSTAAADLRFRTATLLAARADIPALPGSATAKLDALAHLLGVSTWSDRSLAVLKGAAGQQRQLLATALNTPEYLVH
ncbi:MAG TPA: DUF1800 domain-containing protein [Jatrophihabitans sp.]|nr:DUF1800 domain-containing protein [Jatrophihabitans sp.]